MIKKHLHLWLLIILFGFFIGLMLYIRPYYLFIKNDLKISIIKTLFSRDSLKTFNNQVNLLLLGIAGGNHDGPNLSDSIMVANYNLEKNQLTTISLPRDIWSETLKDKINSAYAYGEAKKPGSGQILAKAEIGSVINQPIHYSIIIDFDKFKSLVDYLGGIEVNIDQSFTDPQFPITGKENDDCNGDKEYKCRYETISFNAGKNQFDGETTLKFIRSRHADGKEGTDFARNNRLQKVVKAIEDKIFKILISRDLTKIKKLYEFSHHLVKRDINNQQIAIIFKRILFNQKIKINQLTIDEDFLYNPTVNLNQFKNLWVLIPYNNDYKIIHQYINCYLNNNISSCIRPKVEEKSQ